MATADYKLREPWGGTFCKQNLPEEDGLSWAGRLQLSIAWQQAKRRARPSLCVSPAVKFDGDNFTRTESAQQKYADLRFEELKLWARLKKRVKRARRMTRVQRADYLRRLAREMGVTAK